MGGCDACLANLDLKAACQADRRDSQGHFEANVALQHVRRDTPLCDDQYVPSFIRRSAIFLHAMKLAYTSALSMIRTSLSGDSPLILSGHPDGQPDRLKNFPTMPFGDRGDHGRKGSRAPHIAS